MGPHHPATHGVLRLLVCLEGEVVRDLKPVMGYVHTGIEKSCEDEELLEGDPVRRADGLPLLLLQHAGVLRRGRAAARARDPAARRVPAVIHMELNRIHSHLVWLGTSALDLGAISMFWYCFRERDKILDLFEMSSGQRMHTRYFQVGGVIEDIPVGFAEQGARVLRRDAERGSTSTRRCSTRTRSSSSAPRTSASSRASGCSSSASPGRCCAPPASPGTCARSSHYLPYDDFDFQIPIGTVGDNYDRYRVPHQGDARVGADHPPGDRGAARGPVDRRRPQGRAAAARTSSRPRWRR